jgi:hypothetical protein
MSQEERDQARRRMRNIVLAIGLTAPPVGADLIQAATGTPLPPQPTAVVHTIAGASAMMGALLAALEASRPANEQERRKKRAAARKRAAQRKRQADARKAAPGLTGPQSSQQEAEPKKQTSPEKPQGYERELWERGRSGPRRGLGPRP